MKKIFTLLMISLTLNFAVFATNVYWVGSLNGNWSNPNNWSITSNGTGGFGIPGASDSVIISYPALVKMDASPTIGSLYVGRSDPGGSNTDYPVRLYTATGSVLTVLNNFNLTYVSLIDSTSENVPFKLVMNGATNAIGNINSGLMTFVGRIPVTSGNGATLVAEPGSLFTLRTYSSIISGSNSAYISCVPSSLDFAVTSRYEINNNLDAAIPNATFRPDFVVNPGPVFPPTPPEYLIIIPGPSIYVYGKMGTLKYPSPMPYYKALYFSLTEQATDASLSLPDSSSIGTLSFSNTNGHTITIFNNVASSITKYISLGGIGIGESAKVAMATSTAAAPANSYFLQLSSFNQTSGNFSLQDYNNPLGSSTLAVSHDFIQTGGTFYTNSTSTNSAAKFVLEMNGGDFFLNRPYGQDSRGQSITMSSKTIDNGRKNVTLRVNTPLFGYNGYYFIDKGVILKTPLTVGRLELVRGALNTTDTSLVTVADPSATTGILQTGKRGESYVVGPLRRMINSTSTYAFPLGATGIFGITQFYRPSTITPVSDVPSIYQAEFVNQKFNDLTVTPPLKGVSGTEYWNISKISGADASITLPFYKVITGSSSSDAIVAAHYVNNKWVAENGTILKPGTTDTSILATKVLSAFGSFALGYGNITADTLHNSFDCPKDTTIFADAATCKAKANWQVPVGVFADNYNIVNGDKIYLRGVSNGHAYYVSGNYYTWTAAKDAASAPGAHLVTITSAAENNFINSTVLDPNRQEYSWIGLYNTGKPGQFSWVTGEPLSYTNWGIGEPNNYFGNPLETTIFEPFVHINGFDGNKWNDNGYISARFIAEFDSSLITYRQYSGPAIGAMLDPGVYTICYERTDRQTGRKDSCCFNVTVVCNNTVSASSQQRTIDAMAYPNPTSSTFSLRLKDYNATGNIKMEITDVVGKIIEVRNNIGKDSQVLFGNDYRPGIYFARITQGKDVKIIKLVKQ